MRGTTLAERLRLKAGELAVAERKLMAALFANYPLAGLISAVMTRACWNLPLPPKSGAPGSC